MTRKFCLKNFKTRLVAILAVLCLICTACFGLIACNKTTDKITVTDPSYSKTEEDAKITNPNFYTGTANVNLKNLPIASTTGWGKVAVDNSASTSAVPSGAIITSDSGWDAVLENLADDVDFTKYVGNKYGFIDKDIIDAIKAEKGDNSYTPTAADKKEYIVKTYLKPNFTNPGTHEGATDNAIYMMNNVATSTNYRLGTAQKITSTSTFNLEKGETYKVSVWVKTFGVSNFSGLGDFGANIRLKNTFNSKTQGNFCISNIIAEDWTQYSIYVKADKDYASTITLILGLGYGNGSSTDTKDYVEGTVYFDDITIDKVTTTPDITAYNLVYGSEDDIQATPTNNECVYDMSITNSINSFFADGQLPLPLTGDFTKSNATSGENEITSATYNPSSDFEISEDDGATKISVNQASITVPLTNENFVLDNGEYLVLSFYYKNSLKTLGSTDFTIDVIDMYGNIVKTRNAIASLSTVTEDWTKCVLLIKNNFTDDALRTFSINFLVGPANVRTVEYASNFATGDVYIKDLLYAKGTIDNEEAENRDIYNLLASTSKASVALYAGYANDYQEENNTVPYNIQTAYGNFGDIITNPTAPQGYLGVVSDHVFIKNQTEENTLATVTNTATGKGDGTRVAGVINTQYLQNYVHKSPAQNADDVAYGSSLAEKLAYDEETPAQMLMIKNNVMSSYGFLTSAYNLPSKGYAHIEVTLRVATDDLTNNVAAYVYVVDIANESKDVMKFDHFTVNNDVINGVDKGKRVDGDTLTYALKVTQDMLVDGWVTLDFYIGAGLSAKDFRVEVWNGGRDGDISTASQGYVFIKSINVSTSGGFSEPASWASAFTMEGNPLYTEKQSSFKEEGAQLYAYQRELTETEEKFNKEYPSKAVSYNTNYIWAKNSTMVYGIYNTLDPEIINPYDNIEKDDKTGCAEETDASTFWLSFSSIILAVVLLLALVAIIIKKARAKRKANASDAKSHYKVTSRIKKNDNSKTEKKAKETIVEEKTTTEEENPEEVSEEYVYGDVQSFGEEEKKDE